MGTGISIAVYSDKEIFSEDILAKINNGEYPVILAKDGKFDLLFLSEAQLAEYSHYDALDEDAAAQREKFGQNIPIVYDGFDTGGIPYKVIEAPVSE